LEEVNVRREGGLENCKRNQELHNRYSVRPV
jgi:hypothetical protein